VCVCVCVSLSLSLCGFEIAYVSRVQVVMCNMQTQDLTYTYILDHCFGPSRYHFSLLEVGSGVCVHVCGHLNNCTIEGFFLMDHVGSYICKVMCRCLLAHK
jgi:hypothetical protein